MARPGGAAAVMTVFGLCWGVATVARSHGRRRPAGPWRHGTLADLRRRVTRLGGAPRHGNPERCGGKCPLDVTGRWKLPTRSVANIEWALCTEASAVETAHST